MNDFLNQPAFVVAVYVVAVVGLLTILYGLIQLFNFLKLKQGYASEGQIEKLLMPWLHQCIFSVHEMSEHALELFGRALEVSDKREIARLTYDFLKDIEIGIPGLPLSVRLGDVVSPEQWAGFVQNAFDQLKTWYDQASQGLLDGLELPTLTTPHWAPGSTRERR